jgi:hypothetical protein
MFLNICLPDDGINQLSKRNIYSVIPQKLGSAHGLIFRIKIILHEFRRLPIFFSRSIFVELLYFQCLVFWMFEVKLNPLKTKRICFI